jgi:hypothetical protein
MAYRADPGLQQRRPDRRDDQRAAEHLQRHQSSELTGAAWRAAIAGDDFDPTVDKFLDRAAFVQPVGELGNAPRINPDVRRFWNLTENLSLAKSITVQRIDMDIRIEAFNIFNRVVWGAPNTDFSNSTNFGVIASQANAPRQMQIGLKLYW